MDEPDPSFFLHNFALLASHEVQSSWVGIENVFSVRRNDFLIFQSGTTIGFKRRHWQR
jgi:hypothetical protein